MKKWNINASAFHAVGTAVFEIYQITHQSSPIRCKESEVRQELFCRYALWDKNTYINDVGAQLANAICSEEKKFVQATEYIGEVAIPQPNK